MNYNITFKGLGIDLNISSIAFSILGFEIYWYALCITSGLIIALVYVLSVAKRYSLTEDNIFDSVLIGLPMAIIFARLYYVLFDLSSFTSFWSIFDLRNGGLAIYGAVIGAVIAGIIIYKVRKIDILSLFDVCSLGFLIGQAIGRWGNFFNGEVYGVQTSLPWAMSIKGGYTNALNVHPLFLYESIWNLIGFIVLHFVSKKDINRFKGKIALMYVAWYGIGRAALEGLRDNTYILKLFNVIYVSQLVGILTAILAIVLIIYLQMKKNSKPMQEYVPVYTDASELAEITETKIVDDIDEGNREDVKDENN